ncbi:hypothetical protein [Stenotrophomonas sp. DR009]|uniref:hypothetical protein n=1 Tax=Stenotrophomonas sp. DR009 TaxID=3398461 RepID=UPI003BAE28BD
MQNRAQKKAANAAQNAADSSNAQQQLIYENARGDLKPYQDIGLTGLAGLNALASGDYSGFQNSPDYVYARDQAQQGIERGAAARGSLYSGGTNVDLANALNGIASQNLGAYRNSLMGLAGMGQNASGMIAGVGQNNANAQGSNNWGAANAAGNSAINQANNWSQLGAGLGGLLNGAIQQNAAGRQSAYTPANNLWSGQASTGAGSPYNLGNNLNNLTGWRA